MNLRTLIHLLTPLCVGVGSLLFSACTDRRSAPASPAAERVEQTDDAPVSPQQAVADSVADIMYDHFDNGRYAETIETGHDVIALYASLADTTAMSDAYGTLALAYLRLGNFSGSIAMSRRGLALDSIVGDPAILSMDYNTLAGTYLSDGQYAVAEELIVKAIAWEEKTPDQHNLSNRYGIASEVCAKAKKSKLALEYARRGYDIARQRDDSTQMGTRLSQWGDACMSAAQFEEAERHYKDCEALLALTVQGGDPRGAVSQAINYKQLGNVYERLGQTDKAISYYERSTALARQLGLTSVLTQTLQALGELKGSTEFLKESRALADTLHTHQVEDIMTSYAAQFRFNEKENTIATQALTIRHHRIGMAVGAVVFILVVGALTLYIYLLRLRRKHDLLSARYSEKVVLETRGMPTLAGVDNDSASDSAEQEQGGRLHSEADRQFLERLAASVEAHLSDSSLTTTTLADEFCLSPRQFSRRVKDLTSIDTTHYIRAARILRARTLLTDTDLPISEIAAQCGFETLSYFSRIFRQDVGLSPTDYRKTPSAALAPWDAMFRKEM